MYRIRILLESFQIADQPVQMPIVTEMMAGKCSAAVHKLSTRAESIYMNLEK